MFIIRHQEAGQSGFKWKVVQVLLDKSVNEANVNNGQYWVRFHTRHANDNKTYSIKACRY